MCSYQFHNECTNKTNHTSSRVPYLSSLGKAQKGSAQLWYFLWQLHLHNTSYINKHLKHQIVTIVLFNLPLQQKKEKHRAHTPAGTFAAWILKEPLLVIFKLGLWGRKKYWFWEWFAESAVERKEDESAAIG